MVHETGTFLTEAKATWIRFKKKERSNGWIRFVSLVRHFDYAYTRLACSRPLRHDRLPGLTQDHRPRRY